MGIFNIFKSNNNSSKYNDIEVILSKLNINPREFDEKEMDSVEVTIDDELNEIIKVYELIYENDKIPFDYISLSEKTNGKRNLFLSMSNRNEREIKNLIDLYFNELGADFVYLKEFSSTDLQQFRSENVGQLRNWYDVKYDIGIAFSKNEIAENVYVTVHEK